jgi:hypothetical protein
MQTWTVHKRHVHVLAVHVFSTQQPNSSLLLNKFPPPWVQTCHLILHAGQDTCQSVIVAVKASTLHHATMELCFFQHEHRLPPSSSKSYPTCNGSQCRMMRLISVHLGWLVVLSRSIAHILMVNKLFIMFHISPLLCSKYEPNEMEQRKLDKI